MADNGELREDLKVPDGELGAQLKADFEAGKELLVSKKWFSIEFHQMRFKPKYLFCKLNFSVLF